MQDDERFTLLPPSAQAFYPRLPFAVARAIRKHRPDAIVASDPFVGLAARAGRTLARSPARLIVEVHGDPQTFTRGYGSPRSSHGVAHSPTPRRAPESRRADATRALSAFTSSVVERARGVPATACFPTYSDLDAFADAPLVPVPQDRSLVFVGALEAYKNIDGLADAWRRLVRECPQARLTIVGRGSRRVVVERLIADLPESVEHVSVLEPEGVIAALDAARALVLPSWPEGLGRVVLEAFARGRTVVATDAGGIPDIVTDERDGLLVPPADTGALVAAMQRVLDDHELAVRLGEAARVTYGKWHQTPADFAAAYRDLVDRALGGAR